MGATAMKYTDICLGMYSWVVELDTLSYGTYIVNAPDIGEYSGASRTLIPVEAEH